MLAKVTKVIPRTREKARAVNDGTAMFVRVGTLCEAIGGTYIERGR
jgi:hypothetical protein